MIEPNTSRACWCAPKKLPPLVGKAVDPVRRDDTAPQFLRIDRLSSLTSGIERIAEQRLGDAVSCALQFDETPPCA
jgi:hypothetical protein